MKKHRLLVEHIFDDIDAMNTYVTAVHPGCAAYIRDDLDRSKDSLYRDYVVRRFGDRPDQFLAGRFQKEES